MDVHVFLFVVFMLWQSSNGRTIDQTILESLQRGQDGNITNSLKDAVLLELDIRVSHDEYKELERQPLSKRKATPFEYRRWTGNTIPYTIGDGFTDADKAVVRTAMDEWERYTCLTFREATSLDTNLVKIENGEGCNSGIGMTGGAQIVNLGPGCKAVSVALHELGHAIGLYHEQNRRDRDDYIWVRLEHMNPDYRFAAEITQQGEIENYGVPYDYSSIMHYGMDAFALTKEPTIITNDPAWQFRIGNAMHLSFNDIKIVNIIYKCNSQCGGKTCPGEGYLDENCQCMCPGNPTTPCGTPAPEVDPCVDLNESCGGWASVGECENNPGYMKGACYLSCDLCGEGCKDKQADCQERAYNGECKMNPVDMFANCLESCGLCFGKGHESTCRDTNPQCGPWAARGECTTNPNYMRTGCARSCASCD